MHHGSAETLLGRVVDYAGLFPPAGLSMDDAVREYAAAHDGGDAWMLGRFVLPAARLAEFGRARTAPGMPSGTWRLSAIVGDRSEDDRAAIARFNAASAQHGAVVDTIEAKPAGVEGIDWLAEAFRPPLEVYVEGATGADAAAWLAHVQARGLRVKVRTGGLTADAFPAPDALVAFLEAAVRAGVPFKATAGLHHAVRGAYPLTYAPDAAAAPMYGYLNVLLATAALAAGQPPDAARALLTRDDAATLVFGDDAVRWGGVALPAEVIGRARARHLVSFGSCSFREPAAEYRALATPSTTA
jgi:hypothetical protein